MALKQIRIHHSSGRYRIYECSYCGKQVSMRYTMVQCNQVKSCGCQQKNGLGFDRGTERRKILPLTVPVIYRGVEKSLGDWLVQFNIPRTVFNRWFLDGRRPTWIIARYANGVRSCK